MMTSSAYVWVWLPNQTQPVVAGRLLKAKSGQYQFNYGKSYLERINEHPKAIALSERELPLKSGVIDPLLGLNIHGCLRDAAPDAWGRRIILHRMFSKTDTGWKDRDLDEITYLLQSGSDRIGALDFQLSPTQYEPREYDQVTLEELDEANERIEQGRSLSDALARALFNGTAIGGARPKALINSDGEKYIAKFSSSTDHYDMVKSEYVSMKLASICHIDVADVKLTKANNRDVLLVKRFDREPLPSGWMRKALISSLSLFELDEMMARYASYESLAHMIRQKFSAPSATLTQLFRRLVFNILTGNTDDHARNHAALWDGHQLALSPAYDICPQPRTGHEATQAMLIRGTERYSQLTLCIDACQLFAIKSDTAKAICEEQISLITAHWDQICDEAGLSKAQRNFMWNRQFLNPYSLEGI